MKPKLCRECSNYMNEEDDIWWCSYCDYEEAKPIRVKYKEEI